MRNIIMRKVPTPILIDPRTNHKIISKTSYLDESSAKTLTGEEIGYYFEFGGEKSEFSLEELKQIKDFGEPALRLLGFRPRSFLKDKLNIGISIFAAPNEFSVKGSCSLLSHLLHRMSLKDVVGICSLVARKGGMIKQVAIIPQLAHKGRKAEGFHIIPLPYADDIRSIVCSPSTERMKY
jgi:ATP-dependent DNA helicase 2 subunit 1